MYQHFDCGVLCWIGVDEQIYTKGSGKSSKSRDVADSEEMLGEIFLLREGY